MKINFPLFLCVFQKSNKYSQSYGSFICFFSLPYLYSTLNLLDIHNMRKFKVGRVVRSSFPTSHSTSEELNMVIVVLT